MAVSIKCTDVIQPYNGDSDCAEWLRKVELVAKLQSIDELDRFIPLFLAGGAFAVYESLSDEQKGDYKKLKGALLKAFSLNRSMAYEQFVNRRLLPGETVDVLVADLKRLANLVTERPDEEWLKCGVIHAMPVTVKRQLLTASSVDDMDLSSIVAQARALIQCDQSSVCNVSVSDRKIRNGQQFDIECYRCGQRGHISRECTSSYRSGYRGRNNQGGYRGNRGSDLRGYGGGIRAVDTCHTCGETGHQANTCQVSTGSSAKNA